MHPIAKPRSRFRFPAVAALGLTLASAHTFAVPLTEPNDTFSSRTVLGAGTSAVEDSLSQGTLGNRLAVFDDALSPDETDQFSVAASAGQAFRARTDISASGVDTTLAQFSDNTFTTRLADNDDSPLGVGGGLASAISGTATASGIHLAVSGFPNTPLTVGGSHDESGGYRLEVFELLGLDLVDFLEFTGLLPGASFVAEIVSADFDTVLGLFDGAGNLVTSDDDGGAGLFSRLAGTVGASGNLIFAVSAFADFGFVGTHAREGDYELRLTSTFAPVPEPASLALLGAGVAGFGYRRRNRR